MMQNSLERLFAGLAETLREVIAPALSDEYVRAQATAAAELVANLGSRVEWRCDYLGGVVRRTRSVLTLAVSAAGPDELPASRAVLARPLADPGPSNDVMVRARREHLAALAEVPDWLAGRHEDDRADLAEVAAAVRELLSWQLDDEASRTRTGMYRKGQR